MPLCPGSVQCPERQLGLTSMEKTEGKAQLAFLLRHGKHKKLKKFPLTGTEVTIGRSEDVTYTIMSPHVSRCHAVFQGKGNSWTIYDNQSLNGIFINGTKIKPKDPVCLKDGDEVTFGPPGDCEFTFKYCGCQDSSHKDDFQEHCETKELNQRVPFTTEKPSSAETSSECESNRPKLPKLEADSLSVCQQESKHSTPTRLMVPDFHPSRSGVDSNASRELLAECMSPERCRNKSACTSPLHRSRSASPTEQLKERLACLEKLLEEKENVRLSLEEKLCNKEVELHKSLEAERAKLLNEKAELETALKKNMQETLVAREEQLMAQLLETQRVMLEEKKQIEDAMAQRLQEKDAVMQERLQKEHERLEKELAAKESKAQLLEQQLQETQTHHERARSDLLQQFGDLMETELTCGICSELFIQATTLQCSHTFCKECINQWKQKKKECPICRTPIVTETRSLVLDSFIDRMVMNLAPDMQTRRKEVIEERKSKLGTQPNEVLNKASGSGHVSAIVISDTDSELSHGNNSFSDSDDSVEGVPWAYYGGYGRCYNCGRRGHWANGCPEWL